MARLFVRETGLTFGAWRKRLLLQGEIDRLGNGEKVIRPVFDLGQKAVVSRDNGIFRRDANPFLPLTSELLYLYYREGVEASRSAIRFRYFETQAGPLERRAMARASRMFKARFCVSRAL